MSVPIDHLQLLLTHITTHRWLYDFLFNTDPLADLVILRAQRCKSFLYRSITSTAEPTTSHYNLLDETTHQLSLCIPHFVADDITVGLLVHDRNVARKVQIPASFPTKVQLGVARFARFTAPSLNLDVRALPDRSAIEITLTLLPSTKRQTRLHFTFNGDPFYQYASANVRTSYPTLDDLKMALAKFSKAELCRACPRCHAPATTCCKCDAVLKLKTPTHIFDMSVERRRNSLYRGKYTGVIMIDFLRNGDPALHANLDCTYSVDSICDSNKMTELCEIAVHQSALQVSLQRKRANKNTLPTGHDHTHQLHVSYDNPVDRGRLGDFAAIFVDTLIQNQSSTPKKLSTAISKQEFDVVSADSFGIPHIDTSDHDLYRKTRNRLSAARSNMKRKWRNRSMRLQVVILREMLTCLREKENALKCENEFLSQRVNLTRQISRVHPFQLPH